MMGMVILATAAFFAGGLNAVAGGGTFLTFPALVMLGIPPISANATSAVGVLPGYLGSAASFRREIAPVRGIAVPWLAVIGLAGGLGGALLLLVTPPEAFNALVPWLLLAATGLFAGGPYLTRRLKGRAGEGRGSAVAALLAVSVYGGYFNGGLGILLLAVFSLLGMTDLSAMNGLKNVLSAVLAAIASVAFAVAGVVSWPEAAVIMVASTIGGYVGGALSRSIPVLWLRAGIVAVGLAMSAVFFLKT